MMAEIRIPGDHVLDRSFDRSTDSLKTTLINTEITMELDANDGDSVTAYKPKSNQQVTSGDIIDCEGMSRLAVYVIGTTAELKLEASPDGVAFITIASAPAEDSVLIKDICAKSIKITADGATAIHAVMQG